MPSSRFVLFLLDDLEPDSVRKTIDRIGADVETRIEEVVLVEERPGVPGLQPAERFARERAFRCRVLRAPRALGPGGARKAAFDYAATSGFDHAIAMSGSGRHPPEILSQLLDAAEASPRALVLASRDDVASASRIGAPLFDRLLSLRLADPQSGYRVLPLDALGCVPYRLAASDERFDDHLLIQFRALDAPVVEVPAGASWTESATTAARVVRSLRALASAVDYRGHQLHLSRRHRYMVDEGTHYTLKLSPTGSHMQIVDAIRPGSRVLDLGCSQGLLARPLAEKGVRVTGVDAEPGDRLASELDEYFRWDLELPLDLPVERDFDYVVVADVIEHLRHREQLLRGARRYLKPEGRLIVSTPNIAIWFYRLSLLAGRFEYGPRGVLDETHVHLYTRATFQREVERAGFEIVRRRVTALPFEIIFQSTGRSRAVRSLADLYHAVARIWPSMFAYQHIIEAQITTLDDDATTA